MYQTKKKPTQVFEKKPKTAKKAQPQRRNKEEESEGLFDAVKGKIKEGGLRRSLKVDKDFKFSKSNLSPLLKHADGDKFKFENKQFTMTDRIKKQVQLAINFLK